MTRSETLRKAEEAGDKKKADASLDPREIYARRAARAKAALG